MNNLKKILGYILLFCAFCFICFGIVNVKADTIIYVGYDNEFNVDDTIITYETLYDNIREYLIDHNLATSSDIFISDTMLIGAQNPTTICKIGQNITLNSSNSSVWCDNAYVFSYDNNYNITYNGYPNYYYPGITLSTPEYIGYYYWFGGDENTTLTVTNDSGSDLILDPVSSLSNHIFENSESMTLYEFVNGLKGVSDTPVCTHVPNQIGYASYVDALYFDLHSSSRIPLEGDILLMSKDFVGIGVNADAVGDLSYELADDNTAENIVFNYSTSWDNNTQYPTLKIHYSLSDSTSGGFDSYIHVILRFTLDISQPAIRYFQNNVYIFLDTCNDMNSVSYGYSNYKDNINLSSDPYLENYINNLSLPNLQFFSNFNTLLPAGPVDSILTLPLLMLNTISTNLSGSCSPVNITLPYVNRDIQLNCVNDFYTNIGLGNFLSFVGLVVSVIMLINYFVFLYNWLDHVFTLSHMNVEIWGVDPDSGVKL